MSNRKHPSFFDGRNLPAPPHPADSDRSVTSQHALRLRSIERNADEQRRRISDAKACIAEARRWLREIERELKSMAEPSAQPGA
jgi:hypothetical protein